MRNIRRNDTVSVLCGKDKGKSGRVLMVYPDKARALVEGVNFVKRHTRQTKQEQKGGIIQKENPIHISNLMLVCKHCNKPTRVAYRVLDDGASKARVCGKCREIIG